jgi:hypothetical protein
VSLIGTVTDAQSAVIDILVPNSSFVLAQHAYRRAVPDGSRGRHDVDAHSNTGTANACRGDGAAGSRHDDDLSTLQRLTSLSAICVLLYAFIWEI